MGFWAFPAFIAGAVGVGAAASASGGSGGIGTATTESGTKIPPAGPAEAALRELNLLIATQQIEALQAQFEAFGEEITPEQMAQMQAAQIRALEGIPSIREEIEALREGATPQQRELIAGQAREAFELGRSDIQTGLREGLELIREQVGPGLGLRPGDTPLIDRGQILGREALRQEGQLGRDIRGQQFQQLLDFPLRQGAITLSAVTGAKEFQETLRQRAFANRVALTGEVGAVLGPQRERLAQPMTTGEFTQAPITTFAQLARGLGGLATGIGGGGAGGGGGGG